MSEVRTKQRPEQTAFEQEQLKKRSTLSELWHRFRKNKMSVICLCVVIVMLILICFSTYISPYDYTLADLSQRFLKPSLKHPMGTDEFGRDLCTRLLVGGRISMLISLISVVIGLFFGMIFGAICGFFGKTADAIIMRLMDILMSIPGMMLAIVVSVGLGSGVVNTAIALAIGTVPLITRQLRSSIMLVNNSEYIEAAKSFGVSNFKIIVSHVIPNSLAPVIVQTSQFFGGAIMGIAGLSFLGLGVQPPTPEWGNILNNGISYVYEFSDKWHVIVFPALFIFLAQLCFNLIGDGLRDAMDPRMRK